MADALHATNTSSDTVTDDPTSPATTSFFVSEDWWAILLGSLILAIGLGATWATSSLPTDSTAATEAVAGIHNPLAPWLGKVGPWGNNPLTAFVDKQGASVLPIIGVVLLVSLALFATAAVAMGEQLRAFAPAFVVIFALAILAYLMAGQEVVKASNLEYALWALVVGLAISNTIGTPAWMRPALRTELYIKTGLVLLGAEVLLNQLLALGKPGVFIAWVVTPIVLVTTYLFGQYVLRIPSRSLNMVISADMSVCGVSAAIATAAACKAKKEELSLAVGLSLTFTVLMMGAMPPIIRLLGLSDVVGGAWIGGTIDSTGAVAAAGGMLGPTALKAAVTIKMIQNILIGAVAFAVALYWVTWVERDPHGARPGVGEIWRRFPKFVLGFVGAAIVFSLVADSGPVGAALVNESSESSKLLRNWFFCLAFVSIGLESNFREFARYMAGGKPLVLYLAGQTLNLVLSLAMCWLMFEKVFPDAASTIGP
jgi:uncharacterized membrane protein YadS